MKHNNSAAGISPALMNVGNIDSMIGNNPLVMGQNNNNKKRSLID